MPCASATDSSTRFQYSSVALAHGASAPSLTERSVSGTTSSGSTSSRVPSPSHVGQAPYGELNEKLRGAISSNERPQWVHASDWEKFWSSSRPVVGLHRDRRDALGELERRLDRVGDAPADVGLARRAGRRPPRSCACRSSASRIGSDELAHLAVDARPREPLARELVEQLAVLALAPAHDRRQHLEAGALGQLHDLVDDLIGRLAPDRAPAVEAVRMADPRVEHPQVVVDLGDGADRRARVARRGLLVDRDRRREPLDEVDVGLLHLPEELARVGRQRLHVAALALGVDRVEGERGLAGAGQPREHDQAVTGELERDVLEVVLTGAVDDEAVGAHTSSQCKGVSPTRLARRSILAAMERDLRETPLFEDVEALLSGRCSSPASARPARPATRRPRPTDDGIAFRGERLDRLEGHAARPHLPASGRRRGPAPDHRRTQRRLGASMVARRPAAELPVGSRVEGPAPGLSCSTTGCPPRPGSSPRCRAWSSGIGGRPTAPACSSGSPARSAEQADALGSGTLGGEQDVPAWVPEVESSDDAEGERRSLWLVEVETGEARRVSSGAPQRLGSRLVRRRPRRRDHVRRRRRGRVVRRGGSPDRPRDRRGTVPRDERGAARVGGGLPCRRPGGRDRGRLQRPRRRLRRSSCDRRRERLDDRARRTRRRRRVAGEVARRRPAAGVRPTRAALARARGLARDGRRPGAVVDRRVGRRALPPVSGASFATASRSLTSSHRAPAVDRRGGRGRRRAGGRRPAARRPRRRARCDRPTRAAALDLERRPRDRGRADAAARRRALPARARRARRPDRQRRRPVPRHARCTAALPGLRDPGSRTPAARPATARTSRAGSSATWAGSTSTTCSPASTRRSRPGSPTPIASCSPGAATAASWRPGSRRATGGSRPRSRSRR